MDKLKIDWLVKKNPDWISAELVKEDGTKLSNVSINRVNKRGEVFPNFDEVRPGGEVVGTLWQSPKGAWYLYAPQPDKPQGGANYPSRTASITKAMDTKRQDIAKSQENKNESIKVSSTMRDAVQLAIAEGRPDIETIEKWRAWLWTNFDKEDKDFPPFD